MTSVHVVIHVIVTSRCLAVQRFGIRWMWLEPCGTNALISSHNVGMTRVYVVRDVNTHTARWVGCAFFQALAMFCEGRRYIGCNGGPLYRWLHTSACAVFAGIVRRLRLVKRRVPRSFVFHSGGFSLRTRPRRAWPHLGVFSCAPAASWAYSKQSNQGFARDVLCEFCTVHSLDVACG